MEIKKSEADYTMIDWWKKVFLENYANFEGRARRSEYWYYALVNLAIAAILLFIFFVVSILTSTPLGTSELSLIPLIVLGIYWLIILIPNFAVAVRRLHDTGKTGWLILLGVIPFVSSVGGIVLLIFYCLDSDRGPNQYGPNPKGLDNQFI